MHRGTADNPTEQRTSQGAYLEAAGDGKTKAPEAGKVSGRLAEPEREMGPGTERTRGQEKVPEPKSVDRDLGL